jgi:hypothetical protein
MINWQELTIDNWHIVRWSNRDMIDCPVGYERQEWESSRRYVFLNEDKEIVRMCSYSLSVNSFFDNHSRKITHFALRSEYEAILPKDKA